MNLHGLETVTEVTFDTSKTSDSFVLNGIEQAGQSLSRVSAHLDNVRRIAGVTTYAHVNSNNSFPTGTGIASSASAFAALTLATCNSLSLDLSESELSALARLGSGSASRSIPSGFVEWAPGHDHKSSIAVAIAPPEHWRIMDFVVVVSKSHKDVGSTSGHMLANTSILQAPRVHDAPRRLSTCREAILSRDIEQLIQIIEEDALLMHSVMMTSVPPLLYWTPETLRVINSVRRWHAEGIPVGFTIDAGPNVHIITTVEGSDEVRCRLQQLDCILEVIEATPGSGASVVKAA
jgi:diphosphomevalonate decarboxylase